MQGNSVNCRPNRGIGTRPITSARTLSMAVAMAVSLAPAVAVRAARNVATSGALRPARRIPVGAAIPQITNKQIGRRTREAHRHAVPIVAIAFGLPQHALDEAGEGTLIRRRILGL
jgi:hypothetical protein